MAARLTRREEVMLAIAVNAWAQSAGKRSAGYHGNDERAAVRSLIKKGVMEKTGEEAVRGVKGKYLMAKLTPRGRQLMADQIAEERAAVERLRRTQNGNAKRPALYFPLDSADLRELRKLAREKGWSLRKVDRLGPPVLVDAYAFEGIEVGDDPVFWIGEWGFRGVYYDPQPDAYYRSTPEARYDREPIEPFSFGLIGREDGMARQPNKAPCPAGQSQIKRDSYRRDDGTQVAATKYCIVDPDGITSFGAKTGPRRGKKPLIRRPGKLGGKGFVARPRADQKKILTRCVGRYGYRSCLNSIMVLEKSRALREKYGGYYKGKRTPGTLATLHDWLKSEARKKKWPWKKNPDDGTWELVPEIVVGNGIGKLDVELSREQLQELQDAPEQEPNPGHGLERAGRSIRTLWGDANRMGALARRDVTRLTTLTEQLQKKARASTDAAEREYARRLHASAKKLLGLYGPRRNPCRKCVSNPCACNNPTYAGLPFLYGAGTLDHSEGMVDSAEGEIAFTGGIRDVNVFVEQAALLSDIMGQTSIPHDERDRARGLRSRLMRVLKKCQPRTPKKRNKPPARKKSSRGVMAAFMRGL